MKIRAALTVLLALLLLLTGCAGAGTTEIAAELEVHFFDAGKADAILLTTQNSTVLIDTGEKGFGKTILETLEEKGIEHIDVLIITHFDKDHVGGAAKVLKGINVDTVLQSNQPKDSTEYENYLAALADTGITPITVRETYSFVLDGVSYCVDPPRQTEYQADSSNNSSLIVTVQHGENRFLLAGDAQTQRLEEFLSTNPGVCDVLKVPHHGKEEPLLEELLSVTRPAYAVITSSDQEPESAGVTAALEEAGVGVLLTREGAVTFSSDGQTITAKQT